MSSSLTQPLLALATRRRDATRLARWRTTLAVLALATLIALLAARAGTSTARLGAGALLFAAMAAAWGWRRLVIRDARDPRRFLRGPLRQMDPANADRALRALSLLEPSGAARADGTSADLARVHVARTLAALPGDRLVNASARLARRVAGVSLAVGLLVLAAGFLNAWSVLEGADVLLARSGVAPLRMQWLDGVGVLIRPPEYLHQAPIDEGGRSALVLPYGSVVTLRGTPTRSGRHLFLQDGVTDVPFVEDGAGAVLARYTVHANVVLRIVARFGDVVIPEGESLTIASVADEAPKVRLEGAPRQIRLLEATDDVPLRYEATDDHGLREVHLVLRSGTREERRLLSRFDGETTNDQGGHVLRLRDPFVGKSHVPVDVTVEAKDNDPLTGPKWGASAAITLIPPDVGEPEARQLEGLRRFRDALVDTLAWRMDRTLPKGGGPAALSAFASDDAERANADEALLGDVLGSTQGGVRTPARIRALLFAQQEKTRKAVDAQTRERSDPSRLAVIAATERFVLVVDAVIVGLGQRDTRESAKELADVADDLASSAAQLKAESNDAGHREQHMDVAVNVLRAGGQVMRRLGELGRDLGEIVDADLHRVARARAGRDLVHAELAARDLAARLHRPDPSFGARGGGPRRGGGESGGAQSGPGDDDDGTSPDEVEQAFEEAAQDLERLAQEHSGEISKMEQALAGATGDADMGTLRDEAKRHADAVREAARALPTVGMGSDSWTSKGSAARDLAEQMARSLEDGRPDHAVQTGRSAVGMLDEAKKMLQRGGWLEDPTGERQEEVDAARRKIEGETHWADQAFNQMRKQAAERIRGPLAQGGDEEDKLADRARELQEKGRASGALPQQAIESIGDAERAAREAAEALRRGDADKGLERQHEAQRSLEAARQKLQGDDDEPSQDPSSDGDGRQNSHANVAIPNAGAHKGPEDFRRRVVQGLGQASTSALREAVQRYAEGLLR